MNLNSIIFLILFILFFILQGITFSQQKDSLSILKDPIGKTIDSLFISSDKISSSVDSLFNSKLKGRTYDVDTTVFASSKDSLIFLVKDKKMNIYGEGSINYKTTEIKSSNIFIDFESNNIPHKFQDYTKNPGAIAACSKCVQRNRNARISRHLWP